MNSFYLDEYNTVEQIIEHKRYVATARWRLRPGAPIGKTSEYCTDGALFFEVEDINPQALSEIYDSNPIASTIAVIETLKFSGRLDEAQEVEKLIPFLRQWEEKDSKAAARKEWNEARNELEHLLKRMRTLELVFMDQADE
jgi:hypothetical protein